MGRIIKDHLECGWISKILPPTAEENPAESSRISFRLCIDGHGGTVRFGAGRAEPSRAEPSRAEPSRAEPARRLARKVIVTDNVAENKSCIKLTADYHDYIILRILVYFLLGLFQSLGIPLTSRTLFRINQCSLCAIASYCLRNKFPGNSTSTTS